MLRGVWMFDACKKHADQILADHWAGWAVDLSGAKLRDLVIYYAPERHDAP